MLKAKQYRMLCKKLMIGLSALSVAVGLTACEGAQITWDGGNSIDVNVKDMSVSGSVIAAGAENTGAEVEEREPSPDWVTTLGNEYDTDQLFVVAGVGETTAYISMHEKEEDGTWKEIITTPGFIGKVGLGKTREGDAMTPVGSYRFNKAFGIAPDPGCGLDYMQVTEDDYWSGDEREGYGYNTMVSIKDYPDLDTDNSEHIVDYPVHYQYCMNISYNDECIPGEGSAIFLHCLGPNKPYTGGCVAIPKDKMITVLQNVHEDCVVVIDYLENISLETWKDWGLSEQPVDRVDPYGDIPVVSRDGITEDKTGIDGE